MLYRNTKRIIYCTKSSHLYSYELAVLPGDWLEPYRSFRTLWPPVPTWYRVTTIDLYNTYMTDIIISLWLQHATEHNIAYVLANIIIYSHRDSSYFNDSYIKCSHFHSWFWLVANTFWYTTDDWLLHQLWHHCWLYFTSRPSATRTSVTCSLQMSALLELTWC